MNDISVARTWAMTPRWVKWLLGVSLAVNFIIIGAGAGAALRFKEHGHKHGGFAAIGQIMRALPEDRRDVARQLLHEVKPQLKSMRAERREAHQALAAVVAASPFDTAAAASAFEAVRSKDNLAKAAGHSVMVDVLALLTDEERAEVAENLMRRGKRSKH